MDTDIERKRGQTKQAARGLAGSIGSLGRFLGKQLSLSGMCARQSAGARDRPGSSPGIESLPDLDTPPSEAWSGWNAWTTGWNGRKLVTLGT